MSLTPTEIVTKIAQAGGHIEVKNDKLAIECNQALLDVLLPEIKASKPALMELLTQ